MATAYLAFPFFRLCSFIVATLLFSPSGKNLFDGCSNSTTSVCFLLVTVLSLKMPATCEGKVKTSSTVYVIRRLSSFCRILLS
jgi:hypothetical protein